MRNRNRPLIPCVLSLALAAMACAFPATGTNVPPATTPPEIPATTAAPVTEIPPTTVAPPTLVLPTFTPSPTATASATALPCDRAGFVTDVTVPDGSDFYAGNAFTKTWRLRNNGTCTWTSGYSLIFDHGDAMGAPAAQQLTTGTVAPGQSIDVSVNLTAPGAVGTYRGYFRLRNPSGVVFGIGANGDVAFWAEIEVVPASITLMINPDWLLPLVPVLPLLIANYTVDYANVHTCSGSPFATFRLENTGGQVFQSGAPRLYDDTAGTTLYGTGYSNSPFMNASGACPAGATSLAVDAVGYTAMRIGDTTPHGHNGRLSLQLCTQDDLGGTCVTRETTFVFP